MECFIVLGVGAIAVLVVILRDSVLTRKRLEQNQREWDEYSKNLSEIMKQEDFVGWCYGQSVKYGWSCYYFPNPRIDYTKLTKERKGITGGGSNER